MRKDLENQLCLSKVRTSRMGAFHETVWDRYVFIVRAGVALLAVLSARVGMQGAPDGRVDRGEAFDAGSAAMGDEASERKSDRSETKSLLRRSGARRDGGCGHVGG